MLRAKGGHVFEIQILRLKLMQNVYIMSWIYLLCSNKIQKREHYFCMIIGADVLVDNE